jgi:hypothetical protein
MKKNLLVTLLTLGCTWLLAACGGQSTSSSASSSTQPTATHAVTPTANSEEQGQCNSTRPSSPKGVWNVTCSANTDHYVVNFDTTQSPPTFTILGYTPLAVILTKDVDLVEVHTFTGKSPELAVYWDSTMNELRLYELPADILLPGGKHCSVPQANNPCPN